MFGRNNFISSFHIFSGADDLRPWSRNNRRHPWQAGVHPGLQGPAEPQGVLLDSIVPSLSLSGQPRIKPSVIRQTLSVFSWIHSRLVMDLFLLAGKDSRYHRCGKQGRAPAPPQLISAKDGGMANKGGTGKEIGKINTMTLPCVLWCDCSS